MKIKHFKYVNENCFKVFLKEYGYKLEDVKSFYLYSKSQYHGNILKIYNIHFNDGEVGCFSAVLFKNFNEYHQARLGFSGNKLLCWYENANAKAYKVCDEVVTFN